MRKSSSSEQETFRRLQVQFGKELVADLTRKIPDDWLTAALLDENHVLAKDLRTAVMAAVDAGRNLARQIVIAGLEEVLEQRRKREGENP